MFVRSHRSHRSLTLLRSALLRSLRLLSPFTSLLTHFAHFLVGRMKFLNMCSHCYRVSREQTRFWRSLDPRPLTRSVFVFIHAKIMQRSKFWSMAFFLFMFICLFISSITFCLSHCHLIHVSLDLLTIYPTFCLLLCHLTCVYLPVIVICLFLSP